MPAERGTKSESEDEGAAGCQASRDRIRRQRELETGDEAAAGYAVTSAFSFGWFRPCAIDVS